MSYRYALIVIALVLAAAPAVVVISEAWGEEAATPADRLFETEKANVAGVAASIQEQRDTAAKARFLAETERLDQENKKRARDRQAGERYGQWGPHLVDAAEMYGQDPDALYRVMMCESKGDPGADNGVNKGLFQFHPGTFANTPYGASSIYDGPSQIYAAAWMWSQGRKGEWGCA